MQDKDLYDILGVSWQAGPEEIKRAFRRLARVYHPDANHNNPDAEDRFKDVRAAYNILASPEKRRDYDLQRQQRLKKEGKGKKGLGDLFSIGETATEIFDTIFGPTPQEQRSRTGAGMPRQGGDIELELSLPLKEAIFGGSRLVNLEKEETCPNCQGNGAQPGTPTSRCPKCAGRGAVQRRRGATFSTSSECPRCTGKGVLFEHACIVCHSRGVIQQRKQLNVNIPAGIEDGQVLRLKGEGGPGLHSGPPGELSLTINIEPHETFTREGEALFTEVEIDLAQAILGDTIQIETLEYPAPLVIPPGMQPGTTFTIPGQGLPLSGSDLRGDLLVIVQVTVPEKLTPRQRELFFEFAREAGLKIK